MQQPGEGEKILIYDESDRDLEDTHALLSRNFPRAQVRVAPNYDQYTAEISREDFDLVILNQDLSQETSFTLIQSLRLKDVDPAILVVSRNSNPRAIADAYAAGCNKCIVRSGSWREEVAPAVRAQMA